jgi:hypothetical protein
MAHPVSLTDWMGHSGTSFVANVVISSLATNLWKHEIDSCRNPK